MEIIQQFVSQIGHSETQIEQRGKVQRETTRASEQLLGFLVDEESCVMVWKGMLKNERFKSVA